MCSGIWWVLCWWPVREPTVVSEPRFSSSARRGREGREIRERSTGARTKAAGSDLHSTAERHLMPKKRWVTECLQSCRERTRLRAGFWLAVRKHTQTHTHTLTDGETGKTPVSPSVCVCVCVCVCVYVCLWKKQKKRRSRTAQDGLLRAEWQRNTRH